MQLELRTMLPTAGMSTANVMRPLIDGSSLLLTTSVMRDRNGRDDAATVAAAQAWLLAQLACAGH